MNIYTDAGVAAGDINNDGLTDLFFSGNLVSCRLYLNKGNLQFGDVTKKAGLITDLWCTGVSMVNIYLSASSRLISCGGPVNGITLIDKIGAKNDLYLNEKIVSKPAKKKD